jgi:hypothetical protein
MRRVPGTHLTQCSASSAVRQSNGAGAAIALSGCVSSCSARPAPIAAAASNSTSDQSCRERLNSTRSLLALSDQPGGSLARARVARVGV